MEDDLAVGHERDFFNTINVGRAVHVIIGFNRKADIAPCLDLLGDSGLPVLADLWCDT